MRKNAIVLLFFCGLVISGCELLVGGAVVGSGMYSYFKGELKRTYAEPYDKILNLSIEALDSLQIKITEKTADKISARLDAKRNDETPVVVTITSIAPKITEVSVRSGVFGVWDKKVSELIHASIAQRL